MDAAHYTPVDSSLLPTGQILEVSILKLYSLAAVSTIFTFVATSWFWVAHGSIGCTALVYGSGGGLLMVGKITFAALSAADG